jgi:hypothetical protein
LSAKKNVVLAEIPPYAALRAGTQSGFYDREKKRELLSVKILI